MRHRLPPVVVMAAFCALLAGGCRRKHIDGTVAVDAVLSAWGAKGFTTTEIKSIEPDAWSAGACSRGPLAELDVLMCEYAADETLVVGDGKIVKDWEQDGVATGVVVRNGRTLLAIADTKKIDASGRTIMRLIEAFRAAR